MGPRTSKKGPHLPSTKGRQELDFLRQQHGDQATRALETQAAEDATATRGVDDQAARAAHARRYTPGGMVTIVVTMW